MIDLSRTRTALLEEIEAGNHTGADLIDVTDARFATAEGSVRFRGHTAEELFPVLKLSLSQRFAAVPPAQLNRDLLKPLRHALSNSFRRGNNHDPAKTLSIEIFQGREGVLVAITDEGPGFDVALTFRRFVAQETYYTHAGAGFRDIHAARCTVSYENGGRTVLLCFRPDANHTATSSAVPGGAPSTAREGLRNEPGASQNSAISVGSRHTLLSSSADSPPSAGEWEVCRVYQVPDPAGDAGTYRYVLRVAGPAARPAEEWILTGRFHAEEASAEADFVAAARLYVALPDKHLRIPRPVTRLAEEQRLILFDFDPWMNLGEYLAQKGGVKPLRHSAKKIGRTLAALHGSQAALPSAEPVLLHDRLQAVATRAETNLQAPDLIARFRDCIRTFQSRAVSAPLRPAVPIHGALGWDSIHHGTDGRFYLYRFERCGQSDPGLDLGGYAADLLCFTRANHDEAVYRLCLDAFLTRYNARVEHPVDADDLRLYIVLALAERLARPPSRERPAAEPLLSALEAV